MPQTEPERLSRRAFLSGKLETPAQPPVFRPPWTTQATIEAGCTGCGACIDACPEAILIAGVEGKPHVAFTENACTFCGACADACEEPVFASTDTTPWRVQAKLLDGCMNASGIACRLCTDACETNALKFDLSVRPVGAVRIDAGACTGCGACLPICPVHAIAMVDHQIPERTDA